MTLVIGAVGATLIASALLVLSKKQPREKSGPKNNWQNEDYLAREKDGTWAEGSTHSKTQSRDSGAIDFL